MPILEKLDAFLGFIEDRKNWKFLLSLLLTAIAFFFAFPSYDNIPVGTWQIVFEKGNHLFTNGNFPKGSHEAKLAFRLVFPAIVHFAHLGVTGSIIFLGLVGVLNFYLVLDIAWKILKEKRLATLIGFCSAFIYFGKCSFVELVATIFDGVCISFLLLAFSTRSVPLRMLFIFLAAFSDERGLIASSLLLVYTFFDHKSYSPLQKLFNAQTLYIYMAWAGYFIVRTFLSSHYGLITDSGDIGLRIFLEQIKYIPLGAWLAMEGLWIIIMYAYVLLFQDRKFFELIIFMMVSLVIILISFVVIDISRSLIYFFPALFVALSIINSHVPGNAKLKKYLVYAFALCVLTPPLGIGGAMHGIWMLRSFPAYMLKLINL